MWIWHDLAIITVRSRMQSSSCPDFNNFTEEGLARQLGVKAGLFQLVSSCITGIPLHEEEATRCKVKCFPKIKLLPFRSGLFISFPTLRHVLLVPSSSCPLKHGAGQSGAQISASHSRCWRRRIETYKTILHLFLTAFVLKLVCLCCPCAERSAMEGQDDQNQDLTLFVQNLLKEMQGRFQTMSDSIINRIDDMGSRIDDLEKSISELIQEAGVEGDATASQAAQAAPPARPS